MIATSTRTLYFNWRDTLLYIKSEKVAKEGDCYIYCDSLFCKLGNDLSTKCEDTESLSIEVLNSQARDIRNLFQKNPSDSTTISKTFFFAGDFDINLLDYETS